MITGIRRVTCVGSGLVGQGWATLFALAGYQVTLEDVTEGKVEDAIKRIKKQMRFLEVKGLARDANEAMQRLCGTTSLTEAMGKADYVQESVYESYPAKMEIYQKMDEVTDPKVILASSTSGLMMSEIQKAAKHHPERCIVAHPWNPSYLVPLVELSPGAKTSTETTKRTHELMEDIGKIPVTLRKEVPGFIANRLSAALWREALNLVDLGVASVEDVDKAIVNGPGLRWAIMGPYLTYHLGGGKGGIEYLMRHIDVSKAKWLETMAKWTETPETAVEKAIKGVYEMTLVKEHNLEELEEWRDNRLFDILKSRRKPNS
ncbi:MAG: 3-hydroxyacyl-CoA dehydrogenase NAD-binding domain-containing protein [Candidatus Bathyarchaeota archaeon]|nr:3-hydroxyacyl-CoA dehydrogenase NAD-binding domain-containing protein [Candidatus Bathyarchaeota archaeon]